jgi:hypothetical protein
MAAPKPMGLTPRANDGHSRSVTQRAKYLISWFPGFLMKSFSRRDSRNKTGGKREMLDDQAFIRTGSPARIVKHGIAEGRIMPGTWIAFTLRPSQVADSHPDLGPRSLPLGYLEGQNQRIVDPTYHLCHNDASRRVNPDLRRDLRPGSRVRAPARAGTRDSHRSRRWH